MRSIIVASRRILADTVTLYNYVGEVNDIATYQETILRHCYCPVSVGASKGLPTRRPSETARLYLFDFKTVAQADNGQRRSYLPYDEWKLLDDKSSYWTLSDRGDDFFVKEGNATRFNIVMVSHKDTGTRRMWHFEVDGK